MLLVFILITLQIFAKLSRNTHVLIGYIISFCFPIAIITALILILRNPLNFPWFGLLLAVSDAFMMLLSIFRGYVNVYQKNFYKHKKNMKQMYIWMAAPGYLRIFYQIYNKIKISKDNMYVCRATNRAFMFASFCCICLTFKFKFRYFLKWYCIIFIFYMFLEEELLWGCIPKIKR